MNSGGTCTGAYGSCCSPDDHCAVTLVSLPISACCVQTGGGVVIAVGTGCCVDCSGHSICQGTLGTCWGSGSPGPSLLPLAT